MLLLRDLTHLLRVIKDIVRQEIKAIAVQKVMTLNNYVVKFQSNSRNNVWERPFTKGFTWAKFLWFKDELWLNQCFSQLLDLSSRFPYYPIKCVKFLNINTCLIEGFAPKSITNLGTLSISKLRCCLSVKQLESGWGSASHPDQSCSHVALGLCLAGYWLNCFNSPFNLLLPYIISRFSR